MSTARTALNDLHTLADTITAAGGKVTDRFTAQRARWADLVEHVTEDRPTPLVDLLTGKPDPTPAQWHQAAALQGALTGLALDPQRQAGLLNEAAAALLPLQRAEFAKTTGDNYARAAQGYNKAAKALTEALAVVEADAAPESLMDAPDEVRKAWGAVPTLVATLDAEAQHLDVCADAAGVRNDEAHRFALVVSVPKHQPATARRELWAAWDEATGRAGRWGAVLAHGATLTAPTDPAKVEPYRRAKPMETRYLKVDAGLRPVDYDPEADEPKGAVPVGGTSVSL